MFAEALALHEQTLGTVDGLAVFQCTFGVGQFAAQGLFVGEAGQCDVQDGADALGRETGHDVGAHACGHGAAHVGGVFVVGKQHDGAGRVARGHHHMFERVVGFTFGVHDDQIGLELRQAFAQKRVGWEDGHEVEVVFQQADAQHARALGQPQGVPVSQVGHSQLGGHHHDAQSFFHGGERCNFRASTLGSGQGLRRPSGAGMWVFALPHP